MSLASHQQQLSALGTKITGCLISDESSEDRLFSRLWREVLVFERQFSRFLPDSELSNFNRSAGREQPISQDFYKLLKAARSLSKETEGLYNPFVLPALQSSGYRRSMVRGNESDYVDDFSSRRVVDWKKLKLNTNAACIPVDTAIDLGGCGKGYIAEKLREHLKDLPGYWLSMGGDIAAFGTDNFGEPWRVSIQSAKDPLNDIGFVELPTTGLQAAATSGTISRSGGEGPGAWHHIIDPRTCHPAKTDLQIATVVCGSALKADVLASCAIILGSELAPGFLLSHGVEDFLLQGMNNKKQSIIIANGQNIHLENKAKLGVSHV